MSLDDSTREDELDDEDVSDEFLAQIDDLMDRHKKVLDALDE